MEKRFTFQCPACGSFGVYSTAFTQWDNAAQNWIIESCEDLLRCEDCDKSEEIDSLSWQVELEAGAST